MARGLLSRLRDYFESASVRQVADDPALMAELLLLFRMVLADGEASGRELETLRRVAIDGFGIAPGDYELVLGHLETFGYEITPVQAVAVFRELDHDRRVTLARHMAAIAKADDELNRYEVRLLARVVELLDLDPREVVGPPAA